MTDIMDGSVPLSPNDRRKILQTFYDLQEKDQKNFRTAWDHLRCMMVLWQLEDLASDRVLDYDQRHHTLHAYKALHLLWFDELPALARQPFILHLRNQLPREQSPEKIVEMFKNTLEELVGLCRKIKRPAWLGKKTEAVTITIETFPYRVAR